VIRKITKLLMATVVLSALSGCSGMADSMGKMAGLGVVTQEKSTFDGATIVNVSPTFLYDPDRKWSGNSVKLGARWSSGSPDYVALVMQYSGDVSGYGSAYASLTGVDVNIDGELQSFSARSSTSHDSSGYNTVTKTIYTDSKNSVVIPYSILKQMVDAKDCRLRIHTGKGYEDAVFSIERIPGGQGTATLSIREFMDKVSLVKPTDANAT
jgi:hypothetical protein